MSETSRQKNMSPPIYGFMLQRCQINPYYHAVILDNVAVLVSEGESRMVVEPMCVWVLSYLLKYDSCVSLKELVDDRPEGVGPFAITRAVHALEQRQFIVAPNYEEAWDTHGEINIEEEIDLSGCFVDIAIVGKADASQITTQLRSHGCMVNAGKAQFHIYVTNDIAQRDFCEIADVHRRNGTPWLAIDNTGKDILISPIFHPNFGTCWQCMQYRLQKNQPINQYLARYIDCDVASLRPNLVNVMASQFSASLLLPIIQKYFAYDQNEQGGSQALIQHFSLLREYSLPKNAAKNHHVVSRVNCSYCRSDDCHITTVDENTDKDQSAKKKATKMKAPEKRAAYERRIRGERARRPIHLQLSEQACVNISGGYRTVSAEQTVEKYAHLVSPLVGVVPKLEPYHQQQGVPVINYSSGRNVAMQSHSRFWLNQHLRSGNGGKGKSVAQAKAGALCEAIERYCMVYHDDVDTYASSYLLLEKHIQRTQAPRQQGDSPNEENIPREVIHPNACMNFSDDQYRSRETLNANVQQFYSLIPRFLESEEVIDWTPVFNVSKQHFAYFPTALCYAQGPSEDEMNLIAYPDSNGCAAGNTLEEAILQGLLELIERDAAAIWWYNKISRESVDISSFNNDYLDSVCDYYQSIGRSLHVLNITTDIGVPVFVAISGSQETDKEKIIYAFGAHVDATVAIERCIIELNQLLPIVIGENYLVQDKNLVDWFDSATFERESYLLPKNAESPLSVTDFPVIEKPSVGGALKNVLDKLHHVNLEVYCLELTQQDIGLPVVRMFVPGLRHYWRRLGPGRLYTVPVKMGWLQKEKLESELNAISIVI